MKNIYVCFLSLLIVVLLYESAAAWSSGNRYGGSTSHSYGSTSHTSAWGTSTSHTAGEGTSHTNVYGGSATHYTGGAGRRPALTAGQPTATLTMAVHTIIRLLQSIQRTIRPPR